MSDYCNIHEYWYTERDEVCPYCEIKRLTAENEKLECLNADYAAKIATLKPLNERYRMALEEIADDSMRYKYGDTQMLIDSIEIAREALEVEDE